MSGFCLQQFDLLSDESWHRIVAAQLAIDENRRPSLDKVEIVGRLVAGGVIDEVGYCDLTYEQIKAKSRNISISWVQPCLMVWTNSALLVTVRRSTRGLKGQSGRAPRRVFTFYDPHGLIDKPKSQIQESRKISLMRSETTTLIAHQEPESFDIPELTRLSIKGSSLQQKAAKIALGLAAEVNKF